MYSIFTLIWGEADLLSGNGAVDRCLFSVPFSTSVHGALACIIACESPEQLNSGVMLGIRALFLNLVDMPPGLHIVCALKKFILRFYSHTLKFTILKYAIEWFLVYSQHCATIITI